MSDPTDHLRLPWSVEALEGKYYGTNVVDADGDCVIEFWDNIDQTDPSERERETFTHKFTEEMWRETQTDSHWECQRDYVRACAVVAAMNANCKVEQ